MYGVNASIPKTLVRHLVRYYADTCGDQALTGNPAGHSGHAGSPELLPPKDGEIAQKTEDLVDPTSFTTFSCIICSGPAMNRKKFTGLPGKTFAGVYEDEVILKWLKNFYRRFFSQQFKRNCLPDGPKVVRWRYPPEVICGCPATAARGSGWISWNIYRNGGKWRTPPKGGGPHRQIRETDMEQLMKELAFPEDAVREVTDADKKLQEGHLGPQAG